MAQTLNNSPFTPLALSQTVVKWLMVQYHILACKHHTFYSLIHDLVYHQIFHSLHILSLVSPFVLFIPGIPSILRKMYSTVHACCTVWLVHMGGVV